MGAIYVHELNLILRVFVFCKETCVTNSLTSLNNRHNYSNKRCKNVNWTNTCVFCKQVCEIRISFKIQYLSRVFFNGVKGFFKDFATHKLTGSCVIVELLV